MNKTLLAAAGVGFFALVAYGKVKLASAKAVGVVLVIGALVFAASTPARAE